MDAILAADELTSSLAWRGFVRARKRRSGPRHHGQRFGWIRPTLGVADAVDAQPRNCAVPDSSFDDHPHHLLPLRVVHQVRNSPLRSTHWRKRYPHDHRGMYSQIRPL